MKSARLALAAVGSLVELVHPMLKSVRKLEQAHWKAHFDGQTIGIDLNPGVADNNVFLSGTFQGDTIRGEWSFSGFPGVISEGTFIAEHQ